MPKCPKCQTTLEKDAVFCFECGLKQSLAALPEAQDLVTLGGLQTVDTLARKQGGLTDTPALEPGTVFAGRYQIEQVIGRGGMGIVYRAQDSLAKKPVALKLIRPERLLGTAAIDRLIAEGITARDIRHPNVVAVYDAGKVGDQPYISMEYLPGQSLRAWHREKIQARKDVPVRVAARIIAEVLDGLKAAHDAGVIHRDLKPENIILVSEPDETAAPLKILDFGIARAASAAAESASSTGLGTPSYMAPEQITNPDTAGAPADLYSLSVLFYELLVDVLPRGHWQPPSGGRADVPAGIDALIEAGLSNRPASRPQSTAEYRKRLVDAINLSPVAKTTAKPERLIDPASSGLTKNSALKYVLFGALGLAGLGAVSAIANSGNTRPPGPVDPCSGLQGAAYESCMGISPFEPDREPLQPDPPPQAQLGYARLSGTWDTATGMIYQVRIGEDGGFSGSGVQPDGQRVDLQDQFEGINAAFTAYAPLTGITLNGQMVWDRNCHISFSASDASGYVVSSGQIHVNHIPGGPCP